MKLTEAKLKQLIKEVMTEAAKGVSELPDGVYVMIEKLPTMNAFIIRYVNEKRKSPQKEFGFFGKVVIQEPEDFPCGGALMVSSAQASHGYGPLLYDIMRS